MEKEWIKPVKRISLRDQIYAALKQSIVHLDLKPGQRLNDQLLAKKFDVSRTPVREALKRLEDEGLVETFPGAVTRVTAINEKGAIQLLQVVGTLHVLALKLAFTHLNSEALNQLSQHNEHLHNSLSKRLPEAAIAADTQFHNVILQAADNPEIQIALERMTPKIRRLELIKFKSIHSVISVQQHASIIQAIKNEDLDQALQLMEDNWSTLGTLLLDQE
ncbi:GntR family transcriptional regulator [Pullulanibacillus camelliae]|nr:GntR family transcriptional regulator [Pullulanibacillus camelliae]